MPNSIGSIIRAKRKELNLTQDDAEEIEVDVSVDTNVLMREVRRQKREFGYFFKEYKIFILGIIFIVIIILGVLGYNYFSKKFKVYNPNEVVGYLNNVSVKNSYYNINKDKYYVIVNFDISKYGIKNRFNVNNMILVIGKDEFLPNKNICYKFDNLGNCYKKQYITNNVSNYIVVYEVDSLNINNSYLVYKESYDDVFKIKLNLENYG